MGCGASSTTDRTDAPVAGTLSSQYDLLTQQVESRIRMGKYGDAETIQKKIIQLANASNDTEKIIGGHVKLGDIFLTWGAKNPAKIDEAIGSLSIAQQYYKLKNISDDELLITLNLTLGKAYDSLSQQYPPNSRISSEYRTESGVFYMKAASTISTVHGAACSRLVDIYKSLAALHADNGDLKAAEQFLCKALCITHNSRMASTLEEHEPIVIEDVVKHLAVLRGKNVRMGACIRIQAAYRGYRIRRDLMWKQEYGERAPVTKQNAAIMHCPKCDISQGGTHCAGCGVSLTRRESVPEMRRGSIFSNRSKVSRGS